MNEKIMKETGKLGFGQCESVCPQGIPVINELKRAAEMIE
jgi:predicted aldo/keto reductase-like oxidoreductase